MREREREIYLEYHPAKSIEDFWCFQIYCAYDINLIKRIWLFGKLSNAQCDIRTYRAYGKSHTQIYAWHHICNCIRAILWNMYSRYMYNEKQNEIKFKIVYRVWVCVWTCVYVAYAMWLIPMMWRRRPRCKTKRI